MRFAYILIKVERGQVREVANQLIELDEVSEVHSILVMFFVLCIVIV